MKYFIALFAICLFACKKPKTTPSTPCNINQSLFVGFKWQPTNAVLADLTFASSGVYYEDTVNDGNWTLSNGCDSVYVTRPSNNFYYRILSVTSDTLKLQNPVFGQLVYFR